MKHTIEVDTAMYFNHDGMGGCVFIGDNDDGFEFNITWDELIKNEFEMQTIPHQKSDVLTLDAVNEIHEIITAFEDATKKMRERLTSCLVFDREAWLEANGGKFNHDNRDDFLKYFSHDMVEENG